MFYQSKFNFHGWYGRLENQICDYFVLKSQKFNKLDFSLDSDISIFNWILISEQKLSANRVITEYIYVCPSMGLLGIYSAASRCGQNTQYLSTQDYINSCLSMRSEHQIAWIIIYYSYIYVV